jgi:hypothetical protein
VKVLLVTPMQRQNSVYISKWNVIENEWDLKLSYHNGSDTQREMGVSNVILSVVLGHLVPFNVPNFFIQEWRAWLGLHKAQGSKQNTPSLFPNYSL